MKSSPIAERIAVGLAHSSPAARRQLKALLGPHAGVRVAFSVEDVYDALVHLSMAAPAVLFVEAAQVLGPSTGFVRLVRQQAPHCRVLLLTAGEDEAALLELLRYGAMGFLELHARPDHVARAARALASGEAWVPRRTVAHLLNCLAADADSSASTRVRA